MPTVATGIAPNGSNTAEIKGDGSTITVASTNINFSSATTRAWMHPIAGSGNVNTVTLADYRTVHGTFTSAVTLVHLNGTLELPGLANIVTEIGDVATFFKDGGGGAVRVINYVRKDGTSIIGTGSQTVVFIAPSGTGSDSNSGLTSASPILTATKAQTLLGPSGVLIWLPGSYIDTAGQYTFDLSNTVDIEFRAYANTLVQVFHGQKISGASAFTAHSGTVYKCAVTDAIPTDSSGPNVRSWVFQADKREGSINTANSHPSQKQRSYAVSIASSTSASPGVITTSSPHGLLTGDIVSIAAITGAGATVLNGNNRTVTVLTNSTFSVGVNTSGVGSGGVMTHYYELPHYRMKRVVTATHGGDNPTAELAELVSNTALVGYYVYRLDAGVPTIYFRRTDSADPNTTGAGIWLPSQSTSKKFVYGGNDRNKFKAYGIDTFFQHQCYDFGEFAEAELSACVMFGGHDTGINGTACGVFKDSHCEYAACGSDGMDFHGGNVSLTATRCSKVISVNPWSHKNGDQAASAHQAADVVMTGGLLEGCLNSGYFGFGQSILDGVTSRNNIGFAFGILGYNANGNLDQTLQLNNCVADSNTLGVGAIELGGAPAKVIMRGGSIRNTTGAAFTVSNTNARIEYDGVALDNNGSLADFSGASPTSTITAKRIGYESQHTVTYPPDVGSGVANIRLRGMTVADGFQYQTLSWASPLNAKDTYTPTAAERVILTTDNTGALCNYTQYISYAAISHQITCGSSIIVLLAAGGGNMNGNWQIVGDLSANGDLAVNGGDITTTATALTVNKPLKLHPLGSAPSTPAAGWLYYSTASGQPEFYNGSAWQGLFNATYGDIYLDSDGTATTMSTATTFFDVGPTDWTSGQLSTGITRSGRVINVGAGVVGVYQIDANATLVLVNNGIGNHTFNVRLLVGGVEVPGTRRAVTVGSGATAIATVAMSAQSSIPSTADVKIQVSSDTGTTDTANAQYAVLRLRRV